jgi:galactokinase
VIAADMGQALDEFRIDTPIEQRPDTLWANYVRGTVKHLLRHGVSLRGADIAISGNVPPGTGLSSSASLEIAVLQAFKTLGGLDQLTPTDMARIGQEAENQFVGCACGIMDQLISARGVAGHALLIDCRSLQAKPVPMPRGIAVVVVDSRVKRGLVDSEYNQRRSQCEAAARHFGVKALRDLSLNELEVRGAELDDVVRRRARHVVTENKRTLAAADALAAGDMRSVGRLMAQSHDSMRDDFEITVPPVDQLVDILQHAVGEVGGARMTGGGFGGCAVALMPEDMVGAVREEVARRYRSPSGDPANVYVCHASQGARALDRMPELAEATLHHGQE